MPCAKLLRDEVDEHFTQIPERPDSAACERPGDDMRFVAASAVVHDSEAEDAGPGGAAAEHL
jgi:hypothetical protein